MKVLDYNLPNIIGVIIPAEYSVFIEVQNTVEAPMNVKANYIKNLGLQMRWKLRGIAYD